MSRFLFFLIVIVAAIWWVRRAVSRGGERVRQRPSQRPAAPERMLECTHCGVIVPESEGVREAGHFYCCAGHRHAGPRAH